MPSGTRFWSTKKRLNTLTLKDKLSEIDGAEVTGSDPETFTVENTKTRSMVWSNLRSNYSFEIERVDINEDGNLEAVVRE
jgi:hypothetical protein